MPLTVSDSATLVGDVEDLRAFCLVLDLGSVTGAARAMRESKATVSRRISRLEAALGVTLVERTPRLVRATEDGRAYRDRVGEILELLGAANDAARQRNAVPSGVLRVTSGPEFNAALAPVVVAFTERHPAVELEMIVTQASVDLDREGVDIALRVARGQLPDSSLVAHKIAALDVAVVASPSYVAEHPKVRAPSDLTRHPIAFLRQTLSELAFVHRRTGKTTSLSLARRYAATEMNFVVEIARCGAAIALVPALAVRRDLEAGSLVRLLADHEIPGATWYLLHRATHFVPPKVRAFRELVLETFRS